MEGNCGGGQSKKIIWLGWEKKTFSRGFRDDDHYPVGHANREKGLLGKKAWKENYLGLTQQGRPTNLGPQKGKIGETCYHVGIFVALSRRRN